MSLIPKYTIACDEVRREDNGKILIVGMYTPSILFQRFPGSLPKLTFLTYFETDAVGEFGLTFRLSHVDLGAAAGAEGQAKIQISDPAAGLFLPVPIPNVQFQMPGNYAFTLTGPNFAGWEWILPVGLRTATRVH
jgi:hypothetical protein